MLNNTLLPYMTANSDTMEFATRRRLWALSNGDPLVG